MPAFNKVLFVDDDTMTISIYERMLKLMDFTNEFIPCRNGEQAKNFLIQNRTSLPDIIFVDLHMSVMNGTEFLEWFQNWSQRFEIDLPVYVLSSSLSREDLDHANTFSVDGYIVKPMTPEHLNEISSKYAVG
jgi:two-component SAPR family response regulator